MEEIRNNAIASNESNQTARVVHRNRDIYVLQHETGLIRGMLSGKFQHLHQTSDYPVVGDWVLCQLQGDQVRIQDVLPRTSKFSRKEAGRVTNEQVLAANIDIVFIVTGLDCNFNLSRMLRYKTVVVEGGAKPVFILSKLDLCFDLEHKMHLLRTALQDDFIHPVSSLTGDGLDAVRGYLKPGVTVAFFGSSGVGKSTLANALLEINVMETGDVSVANGKGKHTTTTAELLSLGGGAFLIDTPGMRELQLWCHEEAVDEGFSDIARLSESCRFENCQHQREPGCAVRKALEDGTLQERHYRNFVGLKREARFFEQKQREKEQKQNKVAIKRKPREKRVRIQVD